MPSNAEENAGAEKESTTPVEPPLERIRVSGDGKHFVRGEHDRKFVLWGCNYDHDADGRLLEDYWGREWATVVEDFREMKEIGANVVRIHLQVGRFMEAADRPRETQLKQLSQLVDLAEETRLYLDITGLGCYHKRDVPAWYDVLPRAERWEVQARFWEAVAKTCAHSDAVFCYDLMNEPILPGKNKKETDWLAGEFGGKHFVQRIGLELQGMSRVEMAQAWVDKLESAIRRHDRHHLVTVGVIPWAMTWPGAKPIFHSPEAGGKLDFVSVHFYPKRGKIDEALKALAVYETGKPLVIEEMFPLHSGVDGLSDFIRRSRDITDGWFSFYWGKLPKEYKAADGIGGAITKAWLEKFSELGSEMTKHNAP